MVIARIHPQKKRWSRNILAPPLALIVFDDQLPVRLRLPGLGGQIPSPDWGLLFVSLC
jgi:hypothetical protein